MSYYKYLSSYQNPEGQLVDRLAPRVKDRLHLFNWKSFKNRTVLDLGCNNGLFVREALKHGASRAVGVDKSDCIIGARELAKAEGLDRAEFWQVSLDSPEFRRFCPRFDIVILFSVITHLRDKNEFLDWLDSKVKHILLFESNHGEKYKRHIDLVTKYMYFEKVTYKGKTDIDTKPHYMWECRKPRYEIRYPQISDTPVQWLQLTAITDVGRDIDEDKIMLQDKSYSLQSEKYQKLKEDIRVRGLREPLIVAPKRDTMTIVQGSHRYMALKELGYKDVPCKIIKFFK